MIPKSKLKEFLKKKLHENDAWARKALIKIYDNQTPVEQDSEHTIEHNNIGFTGRDAEFLSSLAKQLQEKEFLSKKQLEILKNMIPKYWRQILEISNKEKLQKLYLQDVGQLELFGKETNNVCQSFNA